MVYGNLMLGWHEDQRESFADILCSDGYVFHVGYFTNHHGCYYRASCDDDPNMKVKMMQARPRVTVLCGMCCGTTVDGLYLLRDTCSKITKWSMVNGVWLD